MLSLEMEGISEGVRSVIMVIVLLLTVLMGFVLIYVFPLQARYENKVGTTLKNALFISIVQFPRSIGLLFVNGIVVALGTNTLSQNDNLLYSCIRGGAVW